MQSNFKTKFMKTTGIVLLIIGFALIIFTSGKFFTREKVVDLGKVEITREKEHNTTGSPLIGIVIMAIGGIALWQGSKK